MELSVQRHVGQRTGLSFSRDRCVRLYDRSLKNDRRSNEQNSVHAAADQWASDDGGANECPAAALRLWALCYGICNFPCFWTEPSTMVLHSEEHEKAPDWLPGEQGNATISVQSKEQEVPQCSSAVQPRDGNLYMPSDRKWKGNTDECQQCYHFKCVGINRHWFLSDMVLSFL